MKHPITVLYKTE